MRSIQYQLSAGKTLSFFALAA